MSELEANEELAAYKNDMKEKNLSVSTRIIRSGLRFSDLMPLIDDLQKTAVEYGMAAQRAIDSHLISIVEVQS